MNYGICNLSIVALRASANHTSEMISQVLFGETFEILETDKSWSYIKLSFDNFEGYINNKQFIEISESKFLKLQSSKSVFSSDILGMITKGNNEFFTIPFGSTLPFFENKQLKLGNNTYTYDSDIITSKCLKEEILHTAYSYLNSPYLWGGRTHFGIDCSGFTQMVYKLCGYKIPRDAKDQSSCGEVLSFIEESEAGDLAFFDNEDGEIIHVGIILNDYHIIHAHGKVRIDTLDHSGIFNADLQKHTHKLRVIKKLI